MNSISIFPSDYWFGLGLLTMVALLAATCATISWGFARKKNLSVAIPSFGAIVLLIPVANHCFNQYEVRANTTLIWLQKLPNGSEYVHTVWWSTDKQLVMSRKALVGMMDGYLNSMRADTKSLARNPENDRLALVRVEPKQHATHSLSIITQNPKVRHLSINLETDVIPSRTDRFLQAQIQTDGKVIESLLYEFCESNSTNLAGFYNPISHEQQERFNALVAEKMHDSLEVSGLKYVQPRLDILP